LLDLKRITQTFGFNVRDVKALYIKIFSVKVETALSSTEG